MTKTYQGALHISSRRPRNAVQGGTASRRDFTCQKGDQLLQDSWRRRQLKKIGGHGFGRVKNRIGSCWPRLRRRGGGGRRLLGKNLRLTRVAFTHSTVRRIVKWCPRPGVGRPAHKSLGHLRESLGLRKLLARCRLGMLKIPLLFPALGFEVTGLMAVVTQPMILPLSLPVPFRLT